MTFRYSNVHTKPAEFVMASYCLTFWPSICTTTMFSHPSWCISRVGRSQNASLVLSYLWGNTGLKKDKRYEETNSMLPSALCVLSVGLLVKPITQYTKMFS